MLISIRRSIIRLSTGWRSTLLIRNKAQTIRLRTSNGKLFKRRKAFFFKLYFVFSLFLLASSYFFSKHKRKHRQMYCNKNTEYIR
jgi:hypothetical protein